MTPFHDLQDYLALPRLTGLRLSPDGNWLAVTVSALAPDGPTFKSSIWRVDTGSAGPARAPAQPAPSSRTQVFGGPPAAPLWRRPRIFPGRAGGRWHS